MDFLWQRFFPRLYYVVNYAPDVLDTINVATMHAGLEDRLMIAPEQLELPVIKFRFGETLTFSADSTPVIGKITSNDNALQVEFVLVDGSIQIQMMGAYWFYTG